jgi:hypothetical protein
MVGGFAREAFVELPSGAFWYIGAGGALVAAAGTVCVGRVALRPPTKYVILGVALGVGTVVGMTLFVASCFGWPWHKGMQEEVMQWGMALGVPVGILAGGVGGWRAWIRRKNQDAERASQH